MPITARTSGRPRLGDIIALAGLKDAAHRRHALRPAEAGHPLRRWNSPIRSSSIVVEPKTKGDQEKLGVALASPTGGAPALPSRLIRRAATPPVKGMGELHLYIKLDILKRTYKVEVDVGAPQVAYRDPLPRPDRARLHPQAAAPAALASSPPGRLRQADGVGNGYYFETKIVGGAVPEGYIPGVEKGVERSAHLRAADRLSGGSTRSWCCSGDCASLDPNAQVIDGGRRARRRGRSLSLS